MDINNLKEIANNSDKFRKEFSRSWGRILMDLENNNVFPEKEMLLSFNEAAIYPFLFKNYHLTNEEYLEIKSRINLAKNLAQRNSLLGDTPVEIELLGATDSNVKSHMDNNTQDIDFRLYENVYNAAKENITIPFLPEHNIVLLERLFEDGITFESTDVLECMNYLWVESILLNASRSEFNNISINLVESVDHILIENLHVFQISELRISPSYLKKLIASNKEFSLSDFKKVISSLPEDLMETAFKKAWSHNIKKNSEDLHFITHPWVQELKRDENHFNLVKNGSGNKIVSLWNDEDLKNNKALFLKNAFLKDKEELANISFWYNIKNKHFDWAKVYDKNDAIKWLKEVDSEQLLHKFNVSEQGISLSAVGMMMHLIGSIYPENISEHYDIHDVACSLIEFTKDSNNAIEDLNVIKFINNVITNHQVNTYDDGVRLFTSLPSESELSSSFGSKGIVENIKSIFIKGSASLDKAILIYEHLDLLNYVEKAQFIERLNPRDVTILREMGYNFDISVVGDVNAPMADSSNSSLFGPSSVDDVKLNSASKSVKNSFVVFLSHEMKLNKSLLKSETYLNELEKISLINSKDDLSAWIDASDSFSNNVKLSSVVRSAVSDYLTNNPMSKDIVDILDSSGNFRDLAPKKEHIGYEKFMQLTNAVVELKKIEKELVGNNASDVSKIQEQVKEIESLYSIPKDVMEGYYQQYVKNKDWSRFAVLESHSHLILEGCASFDLSVSQTQELLKNVTGWNINTRFLNNLQAETFNEGQAALILSCIKKSLAGDNDSYHFNFDSMIDFFSNNSVRKLLLETVKSHYPDLMAFPQIFNLTQDYPVAERINALKEGLISLFGGNKEHLFYTSFSQSSVFPENDSREFLKAVKEESWTIKEKLFIVSSLSRTAKKHTMSSEEVLKALTDFSLLDDRVVLELVHEKNNEKIISSNSNGLFPEFFSHEYVKKNISEILDATDSLKIKWNSNRYSFVYQTEGSHSKTFNCSNFILDEVNLATFNNNLKTDFIHAMRSYRDSTTLEGEDILSYVRMDDDNFENVLGLLSDFGSFENTNKYSSSDNMMKKTHQMVICLLTDAFTSNSLSNQNKESLVNIITMCAISEKFLSSHLFNYNGMEIFKNKEVVAVADIYNKKQAINNMFTRFDFDLGDSDESDNSFKV